MAPFRKGAWVFAVAMAAAAASLLEGVQGLGVTSTVPGWGHGRAGEVRQGMMRLRGGVMWVGGGRQFNRTADPDALPEAAEDTFHPLRERLDSERRIKEIVRKTGKNMRTNEVITLEEKSKYMIRAQNMLRTKSLSVDLTAAQNFQRYVVGDLAFKQQRFGVMYGRIDDEHNAFCDVIYEPPQDGDEECYKMIEDPDEGLVDRVATLLGMRKIGWVFTSRPRKCILSGGDVKMSCEMQEKLEEQSGYDFARSWVSAVITRNDTTGSIVFEAYQISDLAMDMHRRGVLKAPAGHNKGYARTSDPVLVEHKDTQKVDTDFFLNTVPIKTHAAPLFGGRQGEFPIENRPSVVQNGFEVKHILKCHEDLPMSLRLRDFHMLIYLAKILDPVNDLPSLCKAIVSGSELSEGHKAIIETISQQS